MACEGENTNGMVEATNGIVESTKYAEEATNRVAETSNGKAESTNGRRKTKWRPLPAAEVESIIGFQAPSRRSEDGNRNNFRGRGGRRGGRRNRGNGRRGHHYHAADNGYYYPLPQGYIFGPLVELTPSAQIRYQVEYYFSEQNLIGDFYTRGLMDRLGYIPTVLISRFPKMRELPQDVYYIAESLRGSVVVEVHRTGLLLRTCRDPEKWPLPQGKERMWPASALYADAAEFVSSQQLEGLESQMKTSREP